MSSTEEDARRTAQGIRSTADYQREARLNRGAAAAAFDGSLKKGVELADALLEEWELLKLSNPGVTLRLPLIQVFRAIYSSAHARGVNDAWEDAYTSVDDARQSIRNQVEGLHESLGRMIDSLPRPRPAPERKEKT